jgi:uncharacterized spore protein YtfJ
MADVFDTIESAMRTLRERLSVSTVYGEPVSANGVTVIPVSKVSFGFGGGGGSGVVPRGVSGETLAGNGDAAIKAGFGSGGMGGGGMVEPLGYIEISESGSRWVPLEPPRGELFLRVLAVAPALLPTGRGRGGLLRRLLLLLAGQALLGRVLRPGMPEGMRGRLPLPRRAAEKPA